MEFKGCTDPTVGIEWELQLIDSKSLDLVDGILPLMQLFPGTEYVKPEFVQSCVELTSCVAETSDAAVQHIGKTLASLLKRCRDLGMRIIGAGTHPFCRRLALVTPTKRFKKIERNAGYMAHTQIAFSTHVHIGMRSGDEAIKTMSQLTPLLPVFIALSANSPFWHGHKTGHAAYRHRILATGSSFGLPDLFHDWPEYQNFYHTAIKSGTIRHFKDLHWGIRVRPDFGTIEIRTMDAASDLPTLQALVAFARVMAVCVARVKVETVSRVVPRELPRWIERENCLRASHFGLNAKFIYNEKGATRPLRGLVEDLVNVSKPIARDIGEVEGHERARQILIDEPGYSHQLETYAETHSTHAVVESLKRAMYQ